MKTLLSALFLVMAALANAQVAVKPDAEKIKVGEEFGWEIRNQEVVDVEVSIYTASRVVNLCKHHLQPGEHHFTIPTADLLPGKYYLLVEGSGFREQREFAVE